MPRMSGARLFAQMMEGYDVTHIFFVPAFMLKAFAEMEDMPIRRLMVHGEKAAAYMADGYARASGKPGVCMAQMIGASNLAAGIRDAHMAGAPVIAITGGPTPQSRYRHAYQEVEDFTQFDAVTKFNAQVDTVTRLPDLLRQAFRVATSGAPGPVHLRIQSHWGRSPRRKPSSIRWWRAMYQRVPAFRPNRTCSACASARAAGCGEAADDRRRRRRDALGRAGGTGRARGEAADSGRDIAQCQGRHARPHPLAVGVPGAYSRDCANRVLHEADLVFFIGSHAAARSPTTGCSRHPAPR